jgi:dipeptidyl aminopeptidase/acylaminoacyl peptidase
MNGRVLLFAGLAGLLAAPGTMAAQQPKRPFLAADAVRLQDVSDPAVSPDGEWVAYVVRTSEVDQDRRQSDVWMARWDGSRAVRLTHTAEESERTPRWSPDGRWLAFLSSRGDTNEAAQLWLLDRAGGEAERITSLEGGVSDYVWAPDGVRLALVVEDAEPRDSITAGVDTTRKRPKPIVVDRFFFKEDYTGYLGPRRKHLWVLDLATRRLAQLTSGSNDDVLPAWSPDGQTIAFASKRGPDPDRSDDWNLYALEPSPGAEPRRLTASDGNDSDPTWASRPVWSPDARRLAYLRAGPLKLIYYAAQKLATVGADGAGEGLVTPRLDRWVSQPQWSPDGSLYFLLEEDRAFHLARVTASGGEVEPVVSGARVLTGLSIGRNGRIAVVAGTAEAPPELFAVERDGLRPLSNHNADLLAEVQLGSTEEIAFRSRDGTVVHGLMLTPPGYVRGRRYPTILRIHGGPVAQFQHEFDEQLQALAGQGYVVLAINPRGSSGRGEAFARAIYADWGNKDAQDVLAAVDWAVARGIADPDRLGVGGWSYGGILTNYVIAQDRRFKAATSGAGISNILAGYGTDQYVREYEAELGRPWENTRTWLKLSSPFLKADRIVTPTLFLAAEKDFNVPLHNSEQMYQALRSLGRETMLVIYPGEYHGIQRPSFVRDRLERYVAWYGRFLGQAAVGNGPSQVPHLTDAAHRSASRSVERATHFGPSLIAEGVPGDATTISRYRRRRSRRPRAGVRRRDREQRPGAGRERAGRSAGPEPELGRRCHLSRFQRAGSADRPRAGRGYHDALGSCQTAPTIQRRPPRLGADRLESLARHRAAPRPPRADG